jgi:hypothetical protein
MLIAESFSIEIPETTHDKCGGRALEYVATEEEKREAGLAPWQPMPMWQCRRCGFRWRVAVC